MKHSLNPSFPVPFPLPSFPLVSPPSHLPDIDYMNAYLDFTVDPDQYPLEEFQDFVKGLHEDGKAFAAPALWPQ